MRDLRVTPSMPWVDRPISQSGTPGNTPCVPPAAYPALRLPALVAALFIHAAGIAWALIWTEPASEEAPSRPRSEQPRIVMLFAMPPVASNGSQPVTRKRAAPARPVAATESQSGSSSEPSAASAPSAGDGLAERTTSSASMWAWQPNASALNLAQANRRSVMADLPPRPDCDFYNLSPFQCLSLIAKWSLDSTYIVNRHCSRAVPSERYMECGEAGKRAQQTELHAQPR